MNNKPQWYFLLPETHRALDELQIDQLERLRTRLRASDENLVLSLLSTPWASRITQYNCLERVKALYRKDEIDVKFYWKKVLEGYLVNLREYSKAEPYNNFSATHLAFLSRINDLLKKLDVICDEFIVFDHLVIFILCIEESIGSFYDPTGIFSELNSILGIRKPTKHDIDWYFSIIEKVLN